MINKYFKKVDYSILKQLGPKIQMRDKFLKLNGNDQLEAEQQAVILTEGYRALNSIVTSKRSGEVKVIRNTFEGKP